MDSKPYMNKTYTFFLNILKAAIQQRPLNNREAISEKEYSAVIRLAREHCVLPLAADVLCPDTGSIKADRDAGKKEYSSNNKSAYLQNRILYREARRHVIYQASRTANFMLLYQKMQSVGLTPVVMKGLICRMLYPNPEQRASVDEDLLICPEEIYQYHIFLLKNGFVPAAPDADLDQEHELTYEDPETHLCLEVHKTPFPPESEAYGELSTLFDGAMERSVFVTVEGVSVRTLSPTDHLLYLFCHAYKHFLHGGFGIRQVCDIGLFTEKYMEALDWGCLSARFGELHLREFAAAIYCILKRYLGIKCNGLPEDLSDEAINEEPLLLDILSGGLYGVNDENRTHSSTITLNAAAAAMRGQKNEKLHLLRTLFPKRSTMEQRYLFVRKYPVLLPLGWFLRIITYLRKQGKEKHIDSKESIRIGQERVRLMKMYHMVE